MYFALIARFAGDRSISSRPRKNALNETAIERLVRNREKTNSFGPMLLIARPQEISRFFVQIFPKFPPRRDDPKLINRIESKIIPFFRRLLGSEEPSHINATRRLKFASRLLKDAEPPTSGGSKKPCAPESGGALYNIPRQHRISESTRRRNAYPSGDLTSPAIGENQRGADAFYKVGSTPLSADSLKNCAYNLNWCP